MRFLLPLKIIKGSSISRTLLVGTRSSSLLQGVRSHHKFCIIGSGPAGFYAAQQLLKSDPKCTVDLFEKLPVPFGLVRYGVAPDHPEVKNVTNTFTNVLKNERVNFIGNFEAGKDVTLDKLREAYHAILLAHGASSDRYLNIPGESEHVTSARSFVGWYNGLPENRDLNINLRNKRKVFIIGQGNVALDIARILLSPIETLEQTDISPYALEGLKKSDVEEVVICGRRGPLQVAFTIKELRELVNLKGVGARVDLRDFEGVEPILKDLARPRKRLTELMLQTAKSSPKPHTKSWSLKFMHSPLKVEEVKDKENLLLTLEKNKFKEGGGDSVTGTGELIKEECDLVFRSVGYKGRRLFPELPFNEATGVIPNVEGKIGEGLYCCGWAAQGPRGVILSTMQNSFEVAKSIIQDMKETGGNKKEGFQAFKDSITKRLTFYKDFAKIAEFEEKNRRKVTSVEEMLEIVNGTK